MAEEHTKKRLGRGLAALIGELDEPTPNAGRAETRADRKVPIEHVRANPANPRRTFNDSELGELAASIEEHGIVQPLLVRPAPENDDGVRYELIAGERRWRAAQRAGLHEVPVVIREVDDQQALELAIIENVQRADLNAIEEALGYQQLIDEYGYKHGKLAEVIGKSRSHVANTLRLMKLPDSVRQMVADGRLTAGHARALITADDPQALANRIASEGLSVRQVEALAQGPSEPKTSKSTSKPARNADIVALEKQLEDALGLKVGIQYNDNGAGELKVRFRNVEQLDAVCRRLQDGI